MGKKAYVGVSDKARTVKNIYVGVGGKARKVVKGYVGVNGVARQFWPSIIVPSDVNRCVPLRDEYPNGNYSLQTAPPEDLICYVIREYIKLRLDHFMHLVEGDAQELERKTLEFIQFATEYAIPNIKSNAVFITAGLTGTDLGWPTFYLQIYNASSDLDLSSVGIQTDVEGSVYHAAGNYNNYDNYYVPSIDDVYTFEFRRRIYCSMRFDNGSKTRGVYTNQTYKFVSFGRGYGSSGGYVFESYYLGTDYRHQVTFTNVDCEFSKVEDGGLLYKWDFTKSWIDEISGLNINSRITQQPYSPEDYWGRTRDAQGVHFTQSDTTMYLNASFIQWGYMTEFDITYTNRFKQYSPTLFNFNAPSLRWYEDYNDWILEIPSYSYRFRLGLNDYDFFNGHTIGLMLVSKRQQYSFNTNYGYLQIYRDGVMVYEVPQSFPYYGHNYAVVYSRFIIGKAVSLDVTITGMRVKYVGDEREHW